MRAVLQRVLYAKVTVNGHIESCIDKGIMILVGFEPSDDEKSMTYILNKVVNMRIFEDENDKMNLSLLDVKGELLIVPNFTLYGDGRKGNRPSYSSGSNSVQAETQFKQFLNIVKQAGIDLHSGVFQADMKVELLNDGPVTILLDSDRNF